MNFIKTSVNESVELNADIKKDLKNYFLIIVQLFLILLVVYLFKLEEANGLLLILTPLFIGFIVHSLVPLRYKPLIFVLTSVAGFCSVLGIETALILISIVLIMVIILSLRVNYYLKLTLFLAAATIIFLLRINFLSADWSAIVTPLVGSIFMFRAILYLYEIRHSDLKPNFIQSVSYFLMLPNITFPLFPIVDFKIFIKTYYDSKATELYQRGVFWMFRGILQLLIYRIIYFYFLPSPSDVTDTGSLIVYLLTNYSLLLKISGQAHLIIGILLLFGFNLPPIFNKYLLASGFSDFWRRINIYWKDFVMKVFYYPVYFLFKKFGVKTATVLTLLIIFILTWLLHSYQFFWLQGEFPLTEVDGLFWGTFGVLVAVNAFLQMRKSKKRKLGSRNWNFRESAILSAKVIGMFTFMNLLWALWSSKSLSEWLDLISVFKKSTSLEISIILCSLILVWITGTYIQKPLSLSRIKSLVKTFSLSANPALVLVTAFLMIVLRLNSYYLPPDNRLAIFIRTIEAERLNIADMEETERGYYEPILSITTLSQSLNLSVEEIAPKDWERIDENEAIRQTGDILVNELVPNSKTRFKGTSFEINSWGLRDKEYTLDKPLNTFRIAFLGASFEMASGVEADSGYEAVVERLLNKNNPSTKFDNYEILNFAVGGYGLTRCVKVLESKVLKFQPNAAIYVAHTRELNRTLGRLYKIYTTGADLEYDYLKNITQKIKQEEGIDVPRDIFMRALNDSSLALVKWGYTQFAKICNENNITPIWVFLPTLEGLETKEEVSQLSRLAAEAGFKVTIDLSSVYDGYDLLSLWVQPWDRHPNVKGHHIIAEMLFNKILNHKNQLFDQQ